MTLPPRVSIVLPVHDGARFLAQALDAVCAQTCPDWELVAVDDASTDDTPAMLAAAARRDQRIHVITNASNRKLPGSLNVGFAASRGEYLTWTSDDNWYRRDAIGQLLDHLETSPDLDLAYSDYTVVDDNGERTGSVSVASPSLLAFGNTVGGSFLYRRAVYEGLGNYAEDLFLAEDYDYWLRAAARFRLGVLPKDLYCYRIHGNTLTSQRARQISIAHEAALQRNLPDLGWVTRAGRAWACVELARRAWQWRRRRAVWTLLFRAVRAEPRLLWQRRGWRPQQLFAPSHAALLNPRDLADLQWTLEGKEGIWRLAGRAGFGLPSSRQH